MIKRRKMDLLEILLIIIPITNAFGIDRLIFKDTKWAIIRILITIFTVGTVGLILWVIDLLFLIRD